MNRLYAYPAVRTGSDMDDPSELKFVGTPQELANIEHSDLCVTLYTIWDTLRERGKMAERNLFSCRNDSCVPDSTFGEFARTALAGTDSVVDHGELFLLAALPYEQFRDTVAKTLYAALEAL